MYNSSNFLTGILFAGFPAAAYAAYATNRGAYSGYPSFGLPYHPAGNNIPLLPNPFMHRTNSGHFLMSRACHAIVNT